MPAPTQPMRQKPPTLLVLHGAFYALCWAGLIGQLSMDWSVNPQYAYGWGVPFLSLFLIWKHHETKPAARPPSDASRLFHALFGLLLLCLLPLRWLQEANPDWRLVSWTYALWTVAISWLGVYFHGGWPWLKRFGCAIGLILLAVPWPTPIEVYFIQNLMRAVASVTVEAVNWAGVPAAQYGNLISLPQGVVGVNEACSGVRSFQATLMAAVFLGDLHRLSPGRRWILVGGGILLAVLFNIARSIFLTWITVRSDLLQFANVHDPAGYIVMVLAFLCLLAIAAPLKKKASQGKAQPGEASTAPRMFTMRAAASSILWIGLVYLSVEVWYRAHEQALPGKTGWTVRWPADVKELRFPSIHESIRVNLRYNEGRAARFLDGEDNQWRVYYFYWKPGRTSAQLARSHSPEICLPASGLEMKGPVRQTVVRVEDLRIPFRTYLFELNDSPLYVFFCLWEDRPEGDRSAVPERPSLDRAERFKAALRGERHLGQRFLEIMIQGPANRDDALNLLRERLPEIVDPL